MVCLRFVDQGCRHLGPFATSQVARRLKKPLRLPRVDEEVRRVGAIDY